MKNLTPYFLGKLFFLSLVAFIAMFMLSYFWHGIFFNDYDRQYMESTFSSKNYFYFTIALKYLLMGLLIGCGYVIFTGNKSSMLMGLIIGTVSSLFFIIPLLVEYSKSDTAVAVHLLVDIGWQIFEQITGGLIVVLLDYFFFQKKVNFS